MSLGTTSPLPSPVNTPRVWRGYYNSHDITLLNHQVRFFIMISFHFYALEGPSIFCHFCQAYYFKCFLFPFSFVEKRDPDPPALANLFLLGPIRSTRT